MPDGKDTHIGMMHLYGHDKKVLITKSTGYAKAGYSKG